MPKVIWKPQPGPQMQFFRCGVPEIFYGGARGGGKTHALIFHWVRHAAKYGDKAVGVFLRRSYPELDEVIREQRRYYPMLGAEWRASDREWIFPGGAVLRMRYLERDDDVMRYQGHQYSWIAFDELTQWPRPDPIDAMRACLRSAEGVRCWFLATGNPGGPGHHWVKRRYIDPAPSGTPFVGEDGQRRIYIPAKVTDNHILLENDPGYIDRLKASGPPWLVRAWLEGDWDVVAGAFLEGVWSRERCVEQPSTIPTTWKRWRAMDWGYARPYAVLWLAMDHDGVIHVYRELYGRSGPNEGVRETPAQVAERIKRAEAAETRAGIRIGPNYADPAIFATQDGSRSIGQQFAEHGVRWVAADARPGSRVSGAQAIVSLLREGRLKVWETCRNLIECLATIPADPRNPEDVDTSAEDHLWDALRYGIMPAMRAPQRKRRKEPAKPMTMEWLEQG